MKGQVSMVDCLNPYCWSVVETLGCVDGGKCKKLVNGVSCAACGDCCDRVCGCACPGEASDFDLDWDGCWCKTGEWQHKRGWAGGNGGDGECDSNFGLAGTGRSSCEVSLTACNAPDWCACDSSQSWACRVCRPGCKWGWARSIRCSEDVSGWRFLARAYNGKHVVLQNKHWERKTSSRTLIPWCMLSTLRMCGDGSAYRISSNWHIQTPSKHTNGVTETRLRLLTPVCQSNR